MKKGATDGTGFNVSNTGITLQKDLDMSGQPFYALGTEDKPFKGTFDGNGKTISGLKTVLFGYTSSATIEKIFLKECNSGSYALLVDNATNTNINSVFVYNSSITTVTTYNDGVGAMIAIANGTTTINACGINANITIKNGSHSAGGFIGNNKGSATINDSYFRGKVEHQSRLHVYFGCMAGGYSSSVSASNNIVSITGGYVYVDEREQGPQMTHYGQIRACLISANVTKNQNNRIYVADSVNYSEYYYEFPSHKLKTGKLRTYLGASGTDLLA